MPDLKLGVVDMPYAAQGGQTTGKVAEILERKYHVMEVFSEIHHDDIEAALITSMQDAVDTLLMGGPATDPFAAAGSEIESEFRKFLTSQEIERMGIPGVPTQAAKDGVSPRFKRGRGPRRPSFISSGLYESSAKAWVE